MTCDDHSPNCLHSNISKQGWKNTQTIEGSTLTTNRYLEEAGLTTEQKKLEDVYTSEKWKEEDLYEVPINRAGIINAKELPPIRKPPLELGHRQGLTPLQLDNKCVSSIVNVKIWQRVSRCMDIRLRARSRQGQVDIYWKYSIDNDIN